MQDIRIYIAEQRGETSIGTTIVSSTLNYGSFVSPHRAAIGRLQQVNTWEVASNRDLDLPLIKSTSSFLIPLAGDLSVTVDGEAHLVPVGTAFIQHSEKNKILNIKALNEPNTAVSFQEFTFSTSTYIPTLPHIVDLPLAASFEKNKMHPVCTELAADFQLYFGAFIGKHDFELQTGSIHKKAFAFALDGNFEVEERILYPFDSLYLPDSNSLDIECLSDTGLLVVLCF
ncbi:hypothetical protein [Sphingobacterium sp.]|uniref:hypothetical protein n=1 Tax=Sphingobacterium sp. TaxID=341027 RepID=UPI0031DA109B